MLSSAFLFLSLLVSSAFASNDWSKPCLDGVCYYDLPSTNQAAGHSGTLKIWGSSTSISDITSAAGWEIINCNPDALRQKLRLICTGSPNCGHLFMDGGPVGKVVRLPEHCGKSAFARVKSSRTSPDQSIPDSVLSKVDRRQVGRPEVRELVLDINFHAAKRDREEIVYFSLIGTNVPDVPTLAVANMTPEGHHWEAGNENVLPLFSYDNSITLIDKSLSCDAITGSVKVVADVDAAFTAVVGVKAAGTVIPPHVETFGAYATLNGEVRGGIELAATLAGHISSGKITLIEKGISGLYFPGILEISPIVSVAASIDAEVGFPAEVLAGVNWKLNDATLALPPSSSPDGKLFHISDAPLKLTITPNVNASGVVEAHLIPTLALKLEAFSKVGARVYVDLDVHARATADVEAAASAEYVAEPHLPKFLHAPHWHPEDDDSEAAPSDRGLTHSESYGGCLDVDGGIDITLGADASFFDQFDVEKKVHLYGKEFTVFNRCFGTKSGQVAPRNRDMKTRHSRHHGLHAIKRALVCVADATGVEHVTVIETTILGSDIEM